MAIGGLLPDATAANVVFVAVGTALIWVGSGWLEEAAELLSAHYGLPDVVQGSLVVAVGSSFPELASVVVAGLAGTFDMGVGTIVGSAIFNVLVIPGLSAVAAEDSVESSRAVVYKEAQFYMIAVSVLVITFALAVIYDPVPGRPLVGVVSRPLALLPLLLYGLYLFIQWQDVSDYVHEAVTGVDVGRQWLRLAGGLAVILAGVELLVAAVGTLGATFGVPTFLGGLIVVAAVTSLPDTLVSVRAARDRRGVTSLANVLGSNTFDLLVAIPVGVLIVGGTEIDFATAVPMLAVLTLATVLLFGTLRTDLVLTRPEAYLLLFAYLVFVAWVVAEAAGATSLVRTG